MNLLVQESELDSYFRLQHADWHQMVEREGVAPVIMQEVSQEGDPPCPACGTAAPLVQGACSDCGLQLA